MLLNATNIGDIEFDILTSILGTMDKETREAYETMSLTICRMI